MKIVTAQLEPGLATARPGERFQFERHGYFVRDLGGKADSGLGAAFNRTVTLKDSWSRP
jgi:glutaminyl-tRNA synthetase